MKNGAEEPEMASMDDLKEVASSLKDKLLSFENKIEAWRYDIVRELREGIESQLRGMEGRLLTAIASVDSKATKNGHNIDDLLRRFPDPFVVADTAAGPVRHFVSSKPTAKKPTARRATAKKPTAKKPTARRSK